MTKLKFGSYKAKIPDINTANLSEKTNLDQEENK